MTWPEERDLILGEARGDLAIAVALLALRRVENGRPGREMGVLSIPAPTFQDQVRVAAVSFRHREQTFRDLGQKPRDPVTGLYAEAFLRAFSAKWAPPGVQNDPNHLNEAHANNLVKLAGHFGDQALASLRLLA